jgi:hypothetical protein
LERRSEQHKQSNISRPSHADLRVRSIFGGVSDAAA